MGQKSKAKRQMRNRMKVIAKEKERRNREYNPMVGRITAEDIRDNRCIQPILRPGLSPEPTVGYTWLYHDGHQLQTSDELHCNYIRF
jgi:hypothetical protein